MSDIQRLGPVAFLDLSSLFKWTHFLPILRREVASVLRARHVAAVVPILVLLVPTFLYAQAPTTADVRSQIQQAVRAYIDANNKPDISALVEMYSREPGVTSVGDGQIIRGWDRIREVFDSMVGAGIELKVSIGYVDVTPLGADYALAVSGTSITAKGPQGEVQLRGAMTLIYHRVAGEWKIIHDHTSTQPASSGSSGMERARADSAAAAAARVSQAQAEAIAAARARSVRIGEGRTVSIDPSKYIFYQFTLPAATCRVTGRIEGVAGGSLDFEGYVMDADNFRNWQTGHQANVYWQSGRLAVASIDAGIAGPGTYYLVVSNLFSVTTAKTVTVDVTVAC